LTWTRDADARDAFVRRVNDAALAFLLRHLPAMPVPDIDVAHNGVKYTIDNLSLSNLRISEDDVTVEVATTSGEKVARKGVGMRSTGGGEADRTPLDADPAALVALRAVDVGARFDDLGWKVRQESFPYLEAEGRADVVVEGAEADDPWGAKHPNGAVWE